MRTGLAASTVTPGSTAPDVSLTTPVNELCAWATLGPTRSRPNATKNAPTLRAACLAISQSFPLICCPRRVSRKTGSKNGCDQNAGDDTTVADYSASVLKDLKRRSQKQRGRRVGGR